jgi:hypothetical protein
MGMIKIYQGKSKPAKKKPGWREQEAAEAAWLKGLQAMTVTNRAPHKPKTAFKPIQVVVSAPVVPEDRLNRPPSLMTPGGAGTKPVARPDILYKDDPIMLARELEARARKFNVAPAYNKGGDQFVTEEELISQLTGNKRRP